MLVGYKISNAIFTSKLIIYIYKKLIAIFPTLSFKIYRKVYLCFDLWLSAKYFVCMGPAVSEQLNILENNIRICLSYALYN